MSVYYGLNSSKYNADKRLGGGGEGDIYSITGDSKHVMKIYKHKQFSNPKEQQEFDNILKETEEKIKVMLKRPVISEFIAWPTDILYDSNKRFSGFTMRKVTGENLHNLISLKTDKLSTIKRIFAAINICVIMDQIHSMDHVCGDFNSDNILIDQNMHAYLVDCDSFHIQDGSRTYRCRVFKPEYIPREIGLKMTDGLDLSNAPLPTFNKYTDYYALSVNIFTLMMNGTYPNQIRTLNGEHSGYPQNFYEQTEPMFPYIEGTPANISAFAKSPPLSIFPTDIQMLFIRTFVTGHTNVKVRPTPREWITALNRYKEDGNLKSCSKTNGFHQYYRTLSNCPYCEAESRYLSITKGKWIGQTPLVPKLVILFKTYDDVVNDPKLIQNCIDVANTGDAKAKGILGRLYLEGEAGLEQNIGYGISNLQEAADVGDPDGQYLLGMCYYDGIGVTKDISTGKRWLKKAADNNNVDAKRMIDYIDKFRTNPLEIKQYESPNDKKPQQNDYFITGLLLESKNDSAFADYYEYSIRTGNPDAISYIGSLFDSCKLNCYNSSIRLKIMRALSDVTQRTDVIFELGKLTYKAAPDTGIPLLEKASNEGIGEASYLLYKYYSDKNKEKASIYHKLTKTQGFSERSIKMKNRSTENETTKFSLKEQIQNNNEKQTVDVDITGEPISNTNMGYNKNTTQPRYVDITGEPIIETNTKNNNSVNQTINEPKKKEKKGFLSRLRRRRS